MFVVENQAPTTAFPRRTTAAAPWRGQFRWESYVRFDAVQLSLKPREPMPILSLRRDCASDEGKLRGVNGSPGGFMSISGRQPHTKGMTVWSKPFMRTGRKNKEMAVLLVDTQGTFDHETSTYLQGSLFGLSTTVSRSHLVGTARGALVLRGFTNMNGCYRIGVGCVIRSNISYAVLLSLSFVFTAELLSDLQREESGANRQSRWSRGLFGVRKTSKGDDGRWGRWARG